MTSPDPKLKPHNIDDICCQCGDCHLMYRIGGAIGRKDWPKAYEYIQEVLGPLRAELAELKAWKEGKKGVEDYYTLKAELARKDKALNDISDHSESPFFGEKWTNYIHDVAEEALRPEEGGKEKI